MADTTVDLRGWRLKWSCKTHNAPKPATEKSADEDGEEAGATAADAEKSRRNRSGGTITLTNNPFWQNLRAGTIVTFTCSDRAHGGMDTAALFAPALGQWHINVWTGDTRYITDGGTGWETNNRDWQLTIKNSAGKTVFGPAGEGLAREHSVAKDEVCKLEEVEPRRFNPAMAVYSGGGTSTFGLTNRWNGGKFSQDLTLLRGWAQPGVEVSWQEWRDYWFKDEEALAGAGDPEADPDNDGVINLVEAALGLNPRRADAERLPVSEVRAAGAAAGGGYYVTLTVDKPTVKVAGIAWRVETSSDEKIWSEQGVVVLTDDARTLQVRDSVKVKPQKLVARFVRMTVLETQ